ncbi:AfsR/SARP family transcriptional regulator [Actinoallomurus rhizosphaericola]|uniref:AfsR/SARP family transcriptional regulator n=1 Tax=Actinoallomurus rhizosphaericola TaxID=2952536 RepID=UPI0020927D15|nr:BTAD domain-containing putative transcriptional regulator [Actinoallomurus rhizosphaericola]MCO5997880.1 NB-ARC domain-containing protein [Actinoallomurus rhizosphaericola]
MPIELGILGETYVRAGAQPIDVGHSRQRSVLAALLVDVNHPVSPTRLAQRVWGEDPPERATGTLRSYLSRLRIALSTTVGADIERTSAGYVLKVNEEAVDLHRFRALTARARASGDVAEAGRLHGLALAQWRGEPFADVDSPWLTEMRHALQAERLATHLDYYDICLRLGRHAGLIPEMLTLAAGHPLNERLAGLILLALYRSGRQAEALEQYERIRLRLAEELGVDPSAALQRMHQQILVNDPVLDPPASPAPGATRVPRQLPAPPSPFIARADELAALDRTLGGPGRTVRISAIGGGAGVGKTWLALHWAHGNADRFPDGQLYVDMRGFDPAEPPMTPEAAVRTFLEALGAETTAVPENLDAQAALYRTLIADKRMLIVVDNVRDTAQVTPLLPGSPSSVVLVTGRNQLAGLVTAHGARPITVDVLPPDAAGRLLDTRLGTHRTRAEPRAVADLLAYCGGLPLALSIVAARASMRPDLPLALLAEKMRAGIAGLDALDAGEATADLRAVFAGSYRTLTPEAARLFRLLSLHPGRDIAHPAAAALAGLPRDRARALLAELFRAHLITERAPGRFAMHDLLRLYAAEQARTCDTEAERSAACHRVLDHYLHTADTAES